MGNGQAYHDSSYGEFGSETNVAPYISNFIYPRIPGTLPSADGNYGLVLDMNDQVLGLDGVGDNITITAQNIGGNLQLSVNDPNSPTYSGVYYSAPAANITSLTIRGSTDLNTLLNETFQLQGPLGLGPNGNGSVTIQAGRGNDTIIVGIAGAGKLDDLTGPLTIIGGAGNDSFIINDTAAPAGHTYTVTGTTVLRDQAAPITYSGINTLTLNTSSFSDVINVQGTAANTATVVNTGAGNDTINVGGLLSTTSTLDAVHGALSVNGVGGNVDVLNVNDSGAVNAAGAPAAHGYTVAANSVTRDGSPSIYYQSMRKLNLSGANGGNNVAVPSTNANVTTLIQSGTGTDNIQVGSVWGNPAASSLDNIQGPLTIDAQAGPTTNIGVNDGGGHGQGPYKYQIRAASFQRQGGPVINTLNYKHRTYQLAAGGTISQIFSNPTGTTLTVTGGAGTNAFAVGNDGNALDDVQGTVVLNAGSGGDTVQFNDQGHGGNETYSVAGGMLTVGRLSDFNVAFNGMSGLALDRSSGDDAYTLNGPAYNLGLAIADGSVSLENDILNANNLQLNSAAVLSGYGTINANINNAGQVNANAGALSVSGAYTQTAGVTNVVSGSALSVTGALNEQAGVLNLSNGTLQVNGGYTVESGATLDGSGQVAADLTNDGTIQVAGYNTIGGLTTPAQSPDGLSDAGVLDMAIAGASSYDTYTDAGSAALGGTLNVQLLNGFMPTPGEWFNLMPDMTSGQFAALNLPNLSGETFVPEYDALGHPGFSLLVLGTTYTSLASNLNPAAPGQSITFTASVMGYSGTPNGLMTFYDGTTVLGTVAVTPGGMGAQASFTTGLRLSCG